MTQPDWRYLRQLAGMSLLACMLTQPALAESADERLERLEREIRELRELMQEQNRTGAEAEARAGAAERSQPAPPVEYRSYRQPMHTGRPGGMMRYYLSSETLDSQPPSAMEPTVSGRVAETHEISFDPVEHDVTGAGPFSDYHDPSAYPYAGIELVGELPVAEAGEYQFVIYPKPARQGGANVSTRMSAWLSVDDAQVLEFRDTPSWASQRGTVRLDPGVHRIRVWAVAASDGFGPSPVESRLLLELKGPGDASPRPLDDLRLPRN
ncbi:uncharacterized protein FOKN1_3071 [Thiohalobacter thiocyanaticus]|uniref:CBM6 domain-containing protein n=1 Tax=Thiohalobacter thiocyanaticus TaxID=585455 RepID=A0A1Z4VVJ4_9GAMM|nr:hypothetical protein [Thiohalobacter thiocyanaticus]BAZ95428.1 uncharacterized protein FOKN1_3071 [Thiohalobacter thiocyanaticus]